MTERLTPRWDRVVLKVSGEAFAGTDGYGIDGEVVTAIETDDGRRVRGYSSDLLVPKWFDKDPNKSPRENSSDLLASAHAAARSFREQPISTVFGAL